MIPIENIVNLTPHDVNIVGVDGNVIHTFPSEGVARAEQRDSFFTTVGSADVTIRVVVSAFGEPIGLPEYTFGKWHIVSLATAQAAAAAGRRCEDLLLTSGPVRNERGQIVGCRQLAAYKSYGICPFCGYPTSYEEGYCPNCGSI